MDIQAAELALIEQIKTTGARVEAFPENPSKYEFLHPELVHLVRYEAATAAEPVPNRQRAIIQETRHEFVVVTVYRHLTKHGGIYAHLEALRKAVVGYTLPDVAQATVFFTVRQNFLQEANGVWMYQSVFAMACPESES